MRAAVAFSDEALSSISRPTAEHWLLDSREAYLKIGGLLPSHCVFHSGCGLLKIATPLARWMARKRVFVRLRKWIGSLRPYPSLALFAVPLIILEPVKPVAAYLMATGQITAGVGVLTIGEILKLILIERLFKLCRRKLLKIPLFAWAYGHWRQGVDWLVSIKAWQAARRWTLSVKLFLRNFLLQSKSAYAAGRRRPAHRSARGRE